MNREFLKEAIADAKAVKESAIANAKVALEEAFTPQLKSMLAAKLEEMDSVDEDDVKEMRGSSYEEDDTMREEMTDPDMRHGEDEDGKPEAGALKATEKDREINEDEEVNLDEILAEIDNEVSEDARTDAEEEGYEDGMEDEKEDMEDDELNLDDMSDDDLKSFIEDVIADMVSAGELEAGTEFEAKDEEVEVEVEDEIEISEEMKDEDKMEEAVGNPISTSVKMGSKNKYDEDFMKAIKGDIKNLSSELKASIQNLKGVQSQNNSLYSTIPEKEKILNLAANNNYYLFLEHDAHNEVITVTKTEKGVRLKDIYTAKDIFN